MSLNCSRYKSHRCIWSSWLLATIVGCGILIYMSYIHRGTIKASCLKCKDTSVNTPEKLTQENCQTTCTTKECVQAASFLLENVKTSADPCDNFYSYACGKLFENYGEEETYSITGQMQHFPKLKLKGILENLKPPYDELSRKVKTMYDSCMSHNASEVNAVPSALEFLKEAGIERWPHLDDNFRFTHLSMEESIGKMMVYLGFFLLHITPTYSEKHSKNGLYNFTIRSTSPVMYNDDTFSVYEKGVFQILNYFDIRNEKATLIWEDFKYIDAYLLNLTQVYSEEDSPVLGYSCRDNKNTSLCDILEYITKHTNNTGRYSIDFVYLQYPLRTQHLLNSLQTFSHRSVANYLALKFFFKHLPVLNTAFQVLYRDMQEHLGGEQSVSMEKWENCIDYMQLTMTIPMSKIYLLHTNLADQLEEIQSIFLTNRKMAVDLLNQQQWMEGTTREALKNKIESLRNEFESFTTQILQNGSYYVEKFHPTNESFLRNFLEIWRSSFEFLSANIAIDTLAFNPFQVNAFFGEEGLHLTLGLIVPPVYKHGYPKLLNLITFSPLISHEFGHHVWDFFENLDDSDATSVKFKQKTKCLEDQYSSYEVKKIGKMIDGLHTVSENLPDLVGFQIAAKILEKYAEQENVNSTLSLPALKYSTKQLLFIAMAQMWCETNNAEDEFRKYRDVHALSAARVINMYRNLKGFSEAFSCPPGSNMNPVDKCSFFEDPSV